MPSLSSVFLIALLAAPMQTVGVLSEAFGPRAAMSDSETKAAMFLADELRSFGYQVEIERFPVKDIGWSQNVIGFRGGPPYHLIGGHYDSKRGSPGADDNASGCAVILEVAKRCSDTNVLFVFFGAEEMVTRRFSDHHFGSRALASSLKRTDLLSMTNIDMVGLGPNLHVRSFSRNNHAENLLAAAKRINPKASYLRDARGLSDHEAFEKRMIPAAWLERRPSPFYHSPRDTKVKTQYLNEAVAIIEELLRR